jgi:hypothetical protein
VKKNGKKEVIALTEDILRRLNLLYRILKDLTPREIADNEVLTRFASEFHWTWQNSVKTERVSLKDSGIDQVFFDRTLLSVRRALELVGAVKE